MFLTLDDVPTDQYPAFVIRTVNNEYYVIGAKERPYPKWCLLFLVHNAIP